MFKTIRIFIVATVLAFAAPVSADSDHPAQKLVEDSISSMLDVMREESDRIKAEPEFLQAKLEEFIMPNLDFESMTRLAVSKFWRRADSNQRQELVDEFTKLLINTYAGALAQYSGESIEFDPFRPESREDRAVVRSRFLPITGDSVPVFYKLRERSGWTIYDIEVNEISLVTSYRSAFSNEIEKNGIDGLIDTLKERNAKS